MYNSRLVAAKQYSKLKSPRNFLVGIISLHVTTALWCIETPCVYSLTPGWGVSVRAFLVYCSTIVNPIKRKALTMSDFSLKTRPAARFGFDARSSCSVCSTDSSPRWLGPTPLVAKLMKAIAKAEIYHYKG